MATSTAPDVALAAATSVIVTLHLIDASGDLYTESIKTATAPTVAAIEAWRADYQLNTQASIYKVSLEQVWEGAQDVGNADAGFRASVKDGINILFRDVAAVETYTGRLVAPVAANFDGDQDIPVFSAGFGALTDEYLAILGGAFTIQSAQYTERRERKNNPRVRP